MDQLFSGGGEVAPSAMRTPHYPIGQLFSVLDRGDGIEHEFAAHAAADGQCLTVLQTGQSVAPRHMTTPFQLGGPSSG